MPVLLNVWSTGQLDSITRECVVHSDSWAHLHEENIQRPNHNDALQQDKETGGHKGFLRGNFVCSSFHRLGAEVGRKDRACGWWLCHIRFHLQPSGYLFFGCTDVIAPGDPFLQKRQLRHPADDSENSWGWARTYIAFPFGAFCLVRCCVHISLQLQKNNSSPLGYQRPFVQTFIIVFDAWCCIMRLPALPLHKSALFRGRDCLVCVTPSEPSTVLGRLPLLGKYWLKEWVNA